MAHSLRLAHTVGVAEWFTALVDRARHSGADEHSTLGAWWSEARCARHYVNADPINATDTDGMRPKKDDDYGRNQANRNPHHSGGKSKAKRNKHVSFPPFAGHGGVAPS